MTEEEWFDTYKPIKNHIDPTSSFDGHMFETYGDEVEFVKFQDTDMIWMLGDGDDGGQRLAHGQCVQPCAAQIGKLGACDGRGANRWCASDGVGQIGAIIVAVDVIAKGGKV